MLYDAIISRLKFLSNDENREGMARFGIRTENAYGVSVTELRKIARLTDPSHDLALRLWSSGIHEARILAAFLDEPDKVTERQMDAWVRDFDSWDVCDQVCGNLFDKTEFAQKKAFEWSHEKDEFVKRAGFVMMAAIAVHDKTADDKDLERFLPVIKRECTDERNYVKKAVNWALRQIGNRDANLIRLALKAAEEISKVDSPAAKWIASDAIRELERKKFS
ncbi:DNA alkylation repair enzyme [uncultured archaeon]|nr:DNA alkylation repair enzyme [uncultured archaeon]